jgi:hypothetical protein
MKLKPNGISGRSRGLPRIGPQPFEELEGVFKHLELSAHRGANGVTAEP